MALNVDGTYEVEALTLEGEFLYGSGSVVVEDDDDTFTKRDESRTDMDLFAKATYALDVADVYGSYKLENQKWTDNKATAGNTEELTSKATTLTVGAEKELEDGVTVTGEVSTGPTTVEDKVKDGDTTEDTETTTSGVVKVKYAF